MSDMWQAAVSQIVSLSETVEHRQRDNIEWIFIALEMW